MSRETVDLANRAYDAIARGDFERFLALTGPDTEIISRYSALEGASFKGRDGVRRWWQNLHSVFPDFHIEVEEMRDFGNSILAVVTIRGHGTGSGAPFEERVWQLTDWRDGKCVWWRTYGTQAEAVEALQLRS